MLKKGYIVLRWMARLGILLLLLTAVLSLALYFVLRSNDLNQRILTQLRPQLHSAGYNLEKIDYIAIDLLGRVDIKGLSLRSVAAEQSADKGQLHLGVKELTSRFTLSTLLQGIVQVDSLESEGIVLVVKQQLADENPDQGEISNSPFTFAELENLISEPAVAVVVKELDLKDISLDLQLSSADQLLQIKQILNLAATLDWNDNKLAGKLQFDSESPDSGDEKSFTFSQTAGQDSLDISFNPSLENQLVWQLDYAAEPWRLDVATAKQDVRLDAVQLQQHVGQAVSTVSRGEISLTADSRLNSTDNSSSDAQGIRSVFPLNVITLVHSDGELLLRQTGQTQFSTGIRHDLQLRLEQPLSEELLSNTESLLDQLSLDSALHLELENPHFKQGPAQGSTTGMQLQITAAIDRAVVSQPLGFASDVKVSGGDINFQQHLASSNEGNPDAASKPLTHVNASFDPAFEMALKGTINTPRLLLSQPVDYQELFAASSAVFSADATTRDVLATLRYADSTEEKLSLKQQKLNVKAQADDGAFSLNEKLELNQLLVTDLQAPVDLAQEFHLQAESRQFEELAFDAFGKFDASHIHVKKNISGDQPNDETSVLSVQGTPDWLFSARGRLSSLNALDKLPKGLKLHFNQQLLVNDLSADIVQPNARPLSISSPREELFVYGDLSDTQYDVHSRLSLKSLALTAMNTPFDLRQRLSLKGDLEWENTRLDSSTYLDKRPLLAMDLTLDNQPENLQVEHKITALLDRHLKGIHSAMADALTEAGELELKFTGDTRLGHNADTAADLDFSNVTDWPFSSNGILSVEQASDSPESRLQLFSPLRLTYKLLHDEQKTPGYQGDIALESTTVQYPPMQAPLTISSVFNNRFNWPLDNATMDGVIRVAEDPLLKVGLSVSDQPEKFDVKSHWQIGSNPQLVKSLPALQALDMLGSASLDFSLNGQMRHPYASWMEVADKTKDLGDLLPVLRGRVDLDGALSQAATERGSLFRLYEPLRFTQSLKLNEQTLTLAGNIQAPSLELMQELAAKSLDFSFDAIASPAQDPRSLELGASLKPASIKLLTTVDPAPGKEPELGHLITPLTLRLSSTFNRSSGNINVSGFQLNTGDGMLDVDASGRGSTKAGEGQVEMLIKSRLKPDLWLAPKISGEGELALPLDLSLIGGERLTLGGELQMTDLSVTGENWGINDINGSLIIDEELEITAQQTIAFLYTLDTDPFQRVDYARIQPYLDDRRQFSVSQISIDKNTAGPLSASLNVRQNLLHLQQLDLALLGGRLAGQLYLDTKQGAWKFGLLGRLNNIRFNELLRATSRLQSLEESPINARVAVEFDLNLFLLEGRIDISDISVLQLMQLLELIDPDYQDEQLSQVRSLLAVSSPRWVSIDMHRGLMDLEIALTKLPTTIKINALPLTPLLRQFAGDYLQELQNLSFVRSGDGQKSTASIEPLISPEEK